MTTLYKPVLIETAEQAEALPIGTVTLPPARHSGRAVATVKCDDGFWRETGEAQPFTGPEMLDEIALVPIEAEEEWALIYDGEDPMPCADEVDAREWARIDGEGQAPSRRLVTPWKSV